MQSAEPVFGHTTPRTESSDRRLAAHCFNDTARIRFSVHWSQETKNGFCMTIQSAWLSPNDSPRSTASPTSQKFASASLVKYPWNSSFWMLTNCWHRSLLESVGLSEPSFSGDASDDRQQKKRHFATRQCKIAPCKMDTGKINELW